jgi:hypothetical protein
MRKSLIRIILSVIVISLVTAFSLSGCKATTGKITLTKSGLIEEDKVTFTLSGTDYSQSYAVSVSSPLATWKNLEYGTYNLTETPDPENKYSYSVTITPEGPYKIGTGADENLSYTLDAINTPTGEIILTKSGLQGTDEVKFTLTSTSGYSQSYTVSTSSPTVTWENLEYGTYNLTEIPDPENKYSYSTTITPEGPYNIGTGNGDQLVYNLNVENEAESKKIEGLLIDTETDEPLVGARVILGIQESETSCYLDSKLSSLTNENGEFTIQVPGPGSYVVFYNISGEMLPSWDGLYLDYSKESTIDLANSIHGDLISIWESMGEGRMLICLMFWAGKEGWLTNVYSETQDLGFAWVFNKPLTINVTSSVSEINLAVWNWTKERGCGYEFRPVRGDTDNTNLQEIEGIKGIQKIGIFEIFN